MDDILTGLPEKTGYWAPVKLREGTYNIEKLKYDFADPPFALGMTTSSGI